MPREVVITVKLKDAASVAAKRIKASFKDLQGALATRVGATDVLQQIKVSAKGASAALEASTARMIRAIEIRRSFAATSKRVEVQVTRTTAAIKRAGRAMARFGAQTLVASRALGRGFVVALKRGSALAITFGATIARVARRVLSFRTLLIGLGAAAVLGGFAKVSASFEKSLSEIVGLVGVSRNQVQAWRKDILALAPAVGKGPGELAKAMFFVTSAGLRGSKALEVLEASAKAATAGLGETEQVADALTSALNAFGKENLSAEKAAGILVATVREGKAAADSIAGSLGKVLPIAASVGVSFDQVGAAIAAMTRIGLDAEVSTTALRAVLNSFLKVGPASAQALDKVGLSAEGMRRQLREEGLLAVLFTLQKALEGNENALVEIIPNVRALTGVLSLVGKNGKQVREIFAALAQETGQSLVTAFQVARDTASFGFAQMSASFERAAIAFGEFVNTVIKSGLGEFVTTTFGVFSEFLENLSDNFDKSGSTAKEFSEVAIVAFKAVGFTVAAVVDTVRLAAAGFRFVRIQAAKFAEDMARLGALNVEVLQALTPDILGLGDGFKQLSLTSGQLVNSLRNVRIQLEKEQETARKTGRAFDKMGEIFDEVEQRIKDAANAARDFGRVGEAPAFVGDLTDDLGDLDIISGDASRALDALSDAIQKVKDQQAREVAAAFDLSAAERAAQAANELRAAVKKIRDEQDKTERSTENLAKRIAALPVAFQAAVLDITNATERLKELEIQEAKTEQRTLALADSFAKRLREAARAVSESFLEMTVDIGFSPLQAAILDFNVSIEESTRQSAQAAAQIWGSFLRDSSLTAVTSAKFVTDTIQQFASAVSNFVGRVLDEAFAGQIRTIKDVAKIAQDVLKSLIKSIIQELVRLAVQAAVTKVIAGFAGEGAVFKGGFTAFQGGGVVTRPTLGLIGEAGQNEAVIPLPDGRNVPVKFTDAEGPQKQGEAIVVNVSAVDARSFQELMATPEGKESIRSAIAEATRFRPTFKKMLAGEG